MQIAESGIANIAEDSGKFLSTSYVDRQRMAVALEGASVRFTAVDTSHLAHADVCQQRGIHILAAGILDLLAKRRPVLCRANLEERSFHGDCRFATLHVEHNLIIHARAV